MKSSLLVAACLLLLSPAAAHAGPYDAWKHSGSLYLLTTPEGANLPAAASIEGFPLLVRLHKDFFDFSQAQKDGADLRCSSSTGEPLAYQIEHWDAAQGVASLWIRVPAIKGNSRQEIKLHWGNAAAASESNGKAVFSESNGYVSVWHMSDPVRDEVGTLATTDAGTTAAAGMIGPARHFPGQKGIFGGDKIPDYPSGAAAHSSEVWFRAERPNATVLGWGNEGGGRGSKVRMQLRSPPHLHIDSDFSDVRGEERLPLGEWVHVVHTYDGQEGRIYVNGHLDSAARPTMNIKSPSRLWLGGWYHNYDFVGDLDEVRISRVARSPDWIKLAYENTRPMQTLAGPLVQPGGEFLVSAKQLAIAEGKTATLSAKAGGAQKVYWIEQRDGRETVVATDRFSYTFGAGRTVGDKSLTLTLRAVYPGEVKSLEIPVTIREAIPEPVFTLEAPAAWDGRQTIEVVPRIANLAEMEARGAGRLNYSWTVADVAVIKEVLPGKLLLKRAQKSSPVTVSVAIDNGGAKVVRSITIVAKEPASDPWVPRIAAADEKPEEGQFFARDDKNEGTLVYRGTLADPADSVFLRVYADEQLYKAESGKVAAEKTYALTVKLKPGLVKYRTEFGTKTGDRETVLHTAGNLVCGDAFLINGQSNAVATDFGKEDPLVPSDWVRTFGATDGSPQGSRLRLWAPAKARSPGGKSEIGYWGMELGRRLVESQKVPICIINGAVGGTRIDQHQRNDADPTEASTIYGRLLWRVQQAKLTHGIRAVLWHQGENDQGADGPTGGYGYETYRQFFVEMAADWKEDYPNLQQTYLFQIWPKSCAMGINGSDNRLREVQRTLPAMFSRMSVMSTLGIQPPGGCHFPAAGYAEFARLICPLVERDLYGKRFVESITPPNLQRAAFAPGKSDEIVLEFDQSVKWEDSLAAHFYLDGAKGKVASGSASGNRVTLKLASPSTAVTITYLDSASWNPAQLLRGENGLAALTFCEVPLLPSKP